MMMLHKIMISLLLVFNLGAAVSKTIMVRKSRTMAMAKLTTTNAELSYHPNVKQPNVKYQADLTPKL